MVGTGLALLIGGLASGAAQVYGAKKGADASKKAAETEGAAAKESLDFLKQKQAEYEAAIQPYRNAGASGLGMASNLLGIPAPATAGTNAAVNPNIPRGPFVPPSMPKMTIANGLTPGGSALFAGGAGRPDATFGGTQPIPGMNAPASNNSGVILVQAPDGSQRSVPSSLATLMIAKGGKVVG